MAEFVRICAQAELPAVGAVKGFETGGREVCVANIGGAICVTDGVCPHEGGPLGEGLVEDGKVVCPWHGYAWNPRTGETADDPDLRLAIFESKLEDGELRAKL